MQDPHLPAADGCRVSPCSQPLTCRLRPQEPHAGVVEERVEGADGVRASTHTGDQEVRKSPLMAQYLPPYLLSDDALEVPHHRRVGMGTRCGAHEVVRALHCGRPVAEGLVQGVLEGAGAGVHRMDLGPHELHAEDVHPLPGDVLRSHVDLRLEAQHRRRHGRGGTMLAGTGLSDDPFLAHALAQERLAHDIVELVGTAVAEVLALQVDPRPAASLGEPASEVQRRRASAVMVHVITQFRLEGAVPLHCFILSLQLLQRGHEDLRNVSAAVPPEAGPILHWHVLTVSMNLSIFKGSL